jgi:prevent-host-death family protein
MTILVKAMKTMSISEFKARALEIIDRVARTKEPLTITKRGKPVAEVIPHREPSGKPIPGRMSAFLLFEKDIVSPLGEDIWEVSK